MTVVMTLEWSKDNYNENVQAVIKKQINGRNKPLGLTPLYFTCGHVYKYYVVSHTLSSAEYISAIVGNCGTTNTCSEALRVLHKSLNV